MKKITFLLLILLCGNILYAQPANDDPSSATALIIGQDFDSNSITSTNVNATDSEENDPSIPNPNCGNYQGSDVWFSVVVPDSGNFVIETSSAENSFFSDTAMAVYSSSMGVLTQEFCDDDGGPGGFSRVVIRGGTPGVQLFIRVWEFGGDLEDDFQISAWSGVPTNDNPDNAVALTVGANFEAESIETTNLFATASEEIDGSIPDPECGTYQGGDVWYSVVVPASGNLIVQTDRGFESNQTAIAVYSGSLDNLVLELCELDNTPNLTGGRADLMGYTSGQTLYIRVWQPGNSLGTASFIISAFERVERPANDDPSGAIVLTVGNDFETGSVVGSNMGATASEDFDPSIPNPDCGSYEGEDVWFEVVVPESGELIIEADNSLGSDIAGIGMAAYLGDLDALVLRNCMTGGSASGLPRMDIINATPGETIYIRIWDQNGNARGSFLISAFLRPERPVNDDPIGATALTIGTTFIDHTLVGVINGATPSEIEDSTIPAPGCGFYSGEDVWYTVNVPDSGALVVETRGIFESETTDSAIAVYSGVIGQLSLEECNDDGGNGGFSLISLVNRAPGETLYVRVWDFGGAQRGTFQISAFDQAPPINDDPVGALPLEVGRRFEDNMVVGTNEASTNSEDFDATIPNPNCANYSGEDVWYTIDVPASGNLNIETNRHEISRLSDTGIAVYSGTIERLVLVDCDDFNGFNSFSRLDLVGQTPGETLYVRVWDNGGSNQGSFTISAFEVQPPVNDEPLNAIMLTVGRDFDANALVGTNELSTDSEENDLSIPTPACALYNGEDVWYTVEVPETGNLNVELDIAENNSRLILDTGLAVYSGEIGAFVEEECDDDNGNGGFSRIDLVDRTPGELLYIRVWSFGAGDEGAFQVSAWSPDVLSVEDNIVTSAMSYYPNPVVDFLNITSETSITTAVVYSAGGKEVKQLNLGLNGKNTIVDMQGLATGLYFVKLTFADAVKTIKVFKE